MSAEIKAAPPLQYRQRFSTFIDSRRGKMFGVAEVVGLAGSCLVFLLVLLSYLYFVVPARSQVTSLTAEKTRLQNNLQTLQGVVSKGQNTKDQVDQIAASLGEFETGYLLRADQGRLELYDELNQMIVKNGLRNTSGPTYTPLDPTGTKTAGGRTTTTKGQYQAVRRFIRDIERSRQFVVINQVELQRANDNSAPTSADDPASGTRGSLISLQLNLATYFQRDNSAGSTAQQPQE